MISRELCTNSTEPDFMNKAYWKSMIFKKLQSCFTYKMDHLIYAERALKSVARSISLSNHFNPHNQFVRWIL